MTVTEEFMTVAALEEWGMHVKPATEVKPGAKQCRWCAKKGTCAAIRQQVIDLFETVQPVGEADDAALASVMAKADMIEAWIKAIRGETERRLLEGHAVPGWKLVAGKKGARAWSDATAVEDILKNSMRLRQDEMYDMKLISPTAAEKVLKPKQYERLAEFITQKSGSPSVAPESDKRPAINPAAVAEQFDVVS